MNAYVVVIFILALAYTFYMGFSDGANAVAPCVATRAIKPRYAIAIAGAVKLIAPIVICYFLASDSVARTVGSLVKEEAFEGISAETGFVFMLSAMIAALGWSALCVLVSVPNSTSHTLLGGIVGAAIAAFGFDMIDWGLVGVRVILMCFSRLRYVSLRGFCSASCFALSARAWTGASRNSSAPCRSST